MKPIVLGTLAMAAIVVASNILVQFPIGQWLTWGAFSYPLTFLVSDLMNRFHGAAAARKVVYSGLIAGLICSFVGTQITGDFGPIVTLRVAIGSALAFLVGQLLDITLFNRLRRSAWWRAPFLSTLLGSTADTMIFFTVAFSAALVWLEPGNDIGWAAEHVALLGVGPTVPLWVSLGVADWCVKLLIDILALLPFRLALAKYAARLA